MSRFTVASSQTSRSEATSCGSLLQQLQSLWDEIGENEVERDKMILQLEQECLDVYRRRVDQCRRQKADLHQLLAEGEAEISNLISVLGERESFLRLERPKGTLKEQVASINPTLEALKRKKDERVNEFLDVQLQIAKIRAEISGAAHQGSFTHPKVDEHDLTLNRLGELNSELHELQKDKNERLQKVNSHIKLIHELSEILCTDFNIVISEVHPSFADPLCQSTSISNETLARLTGVIHSLNQEKKQRLQKLQDLGRTLVDLWQLMETPAAEQKKFDHVTSLISLSSDAGLGHGFLDLNVIQQAELEVGRLNVLKASKMKELVLKKQYELEEICRSVHMDVNTESSREMLTSLIESGKGDLSEMLSSMDRQIEKAKEQALSRKDILDKVDKWTFASEEESWLDDYERDQNRYSAGRGVHKNLKRAEKARVLVSKLPSLVEGLITKINLWEKEKGIPFMYDKVRLLETLEEYTKLRQEKEEEKRRCREQKKLQGQFATEQEALYGSKPSPMRLVPVKKPLGHSSSANMAGGTPNSRRISTPFLHGKLLSSGKDKKENQRVIAGTPTNYVALSKDHLSQNSSALFSP